MALQPNLTATMLRFFRFFNSKKTPKRHERSRLPDGLLCNARPAVLPTDDGSEQWIKMVPLGDFPYHHSGGYTVLPEHIEQMVENFERRSVDVPIDYDHESFWGGSTRAAGWITDVEARLDESDPNDNGLWVKYPEFTPAAEEALRNREFRYFSPVFTTGRLDKGGEGMGAVLLSVALTNDPFFDEGEIDPVGNAASSLTPDDSSSAAHASSDQDDNDAMYRDQMIALLGLEDSATEEEITVAFNSRMAGAGGAGGGAPDVDPPANEAAGETGDAGSEPNANSNGPLTPSGDEDTVESRLQALEQERETALANAANDRAERLVNQAVEDRKILPKHRTAYLNSAKLNYDATKADLDEIPKGAVKPGRIEQPSANSSGSRPRSGLLASVNSAVLEQVDKTLSN